MVSYLLAFITLLYFLLSYNLLGFVYEEIYFIIAFVKKEKNMNFLKALTTSQVHWDDFEGMFTY